jgi:hypothetical protein
MSYDDVLKVAFLVLLVSVAMIFSVSVNILKRGRLYHQVKPESRPRRWVVFSMLSLLAIFLLGFPIWMIWPHALFSKILTLAFGVTYFVVGLTLKWFSGLVDFFIEKMGWPLR